VGPGRTCQVLGVLKAWWEGYSIVVPNRTSTHDLSGVRGGGDSARVVESDYHVIWMTLVDSSLYIKSQ
jgi:hypothetical protein